MSAAPPAPVAPPAPPPARPAAPPKPPKPAQSAAPPTAQPRAAPPACACVAVVGKRNRPLAFRVYDTNGDAYLRNLVLCSLDVVDECAQAQEQSRDEFLGVATTVDGRKLYASRTATGITLCAVLDAAAGVPDANVRACLADVRKAYAKNLANPFLPLDAGEIASPTFYRRVDESVRARLEGAAVRALPRPAPPPRPRKPPTPAR